ncbi:DUF1003 domain-containing protein [Enterococcus quebecensis]|uniref:Cyclic nucleotide-binding protein n=1 Tax=Enterococcus quebecensis TaxID=903983 RepID=A0A1E5H0L0_9ENTE|nr:DUF1003 domain-containing protein [Enterococcus quebecensis]OEG18352.1 cyclic nucleotide-binding protein [Enterococcus quebecensis]OJG72490.1 hypothetical protein RV12_GL000904 [Enterococcus quebecensis]
MTKKNHDEKLKQMSSKHNSEVILKNIEEEIRSFILAVRSDLTKESKITFQELLNYRLDYIKQMISTDSGKMEHLNETIVDSIKDNKTITDKLNPPVKKTLTTGQKTADAIAKFGGSWPFIFIFIAILTIWIIINSTMIFFKPFDPYPYILLNLALSCLAAIQAPIIMMSQNRQEARDREEANNDYQINLKSEIEVNLLHEKMDYLINSQWQHLLQMQNMQIELLGELQEQINELNNKK